MGLVVPGSNRKPRTWSGRAKLFANKILSPLPKKHHLNISHQERFGPTQGLQRHLEQFWFEYAATTNLVPAVGILAVCMLAMAITFGPLGIEQPMQNLWVEFGGLTFDVLFILVVFSLFENRRQNRQDIERQKEIIADYKSWDSEEAKFRIAGALRRLSKRQVHAIDFSGITLSRFEFAKFGIRSIRGSSFFDGKWGDYFKDSKVSLLCVDFSFIECREVTFSPFDPLSGFNANIPRHACFTDCTFIQTDLHGASFNGASLKWTKTPPEELYEYHEDEYGQHQGRSQTDYGPFDQANLAGTSFASVVFENADFRNAENILEAIFTGATGLEEALFDTDEIKRAVLNNAKASIGEVLWGDASFWNRRQRVNTPKRSTFTSIVATSPHLTRW
jgi:uncharacterized protein YjbI with pentapeptide repeats